MMHAQRGTAMVEFAISSLVLLMLLLGILELGRALYTYHTIADAARLGARWAIVRGSGCIDASCPATQSSVKSYVLAHVPLLDPSSVTVTANWPSGEAAGDPVSVTVKYNFNFAVPYIGNSLTMQSTSQMVISE
ncbi:MAG TPA: TadE/TadG family type IV pilus assembly protein [Candidatus Baltobacteraceae bacterium]|nr:TadE/TadG family type IV pilus assembly protein [Candidatus Baltobacteraceae bacterium]